jgi:hypothetical protein
VSPRWLILRNPRVIFALAAALSPIAAAALIHHMGDSAARYEMMSVGTFAALGIGAFAGLQRGTLWAFLSAPWVGFFIGWIDLHAFVWMYAKIDMPLRVAVLVPVWGTLFGLWVSLHVRPPMRKILTVGVTAGVDCLARYGWDVLRLGDATADVLSKAFTTIARTHVDWNWVGDSLIYSPTALCIVLIMPRACKPDTELPTVPQDR